MGDGGRDGIPREHCGGGEGELNVSTVRERVSRKPRGEKETGKYMWCRRHTSHHSLHFNNMLNTKGS